MPLARIITDAADDSVELAMQLRARGYRVETVAPGEVPSTPADLEVRVEECAADEVLTRADQTTESDDLWVFVAPGALDETARPIRTIPVVPESAVARAEPVPLPKPKAELPAILPLLSIDGLDEDLILAELREFPKAAAPMRSPEPQTTTSLVAVSEVTSTPLPEQTASTATDAFAQAVVVESAVVIESEGAGSEREPTPDTPKDSPQDVVSPAIDMATEPVANDVMIPAPAVVRTRRPVLLVRFNLRPWKIAFVSTALAIAGWFLVRTLHPGMGPAPVQSTLLRAKPSPSFSQRPNVVPAQGQHTLTPPQVPAAGLTPATPVHSKAVGVARSARTRHRPLASPRRDGLIAEDTVVFYDRKPGPPRTKAQSAPGSKQYSDHN